MHPRTDGYDSEQSGVQKPRRHKSQRGSSRTKNKIALLAAQNSSSHFNQFGNSSEILGQETLVAPASTADLVSGQDSGKPLPQPSDNIFKNGQFPFWPHYTVSPKMIQDLPFRNDFVSHVD
jgi:hypothetical protein